MIRPIDEIDLEAVLALNNAHPGELGLVDERALRAFLAVSAEATAIGPPGDPDAFALAFDETTPPQGPNHAWFLARRPKFLYVDRVCTHPRARRRGLARALYDHLLLRAAARGTPLLSCEVTSDPPNPLSDAFHAALGFHEVGRAFVAERRKSVRYLERAV